MSNLDKRILYIDYDHADIVDNEGAIAMQRPSISYGGNPTWQLNFVRVNNDGTLSGIDLSEVISYNAAIDTDFLSSTMPMVRSLDSDIDHSQAASGIISVSLNAGTETFFAKVDGRNTVPAFFEIRGRDSEDKCILDYRFPINALGAIDPQGGDPIPIPSGGVTINDVYALLRSATEFRFSADGTNWHSQQTTGDVYYESRYPQGEWSEPIEIVKGTDGEDGHNVQFEYSETGSAWHTTPTANDKYFRTSNNGGTTWTNGILFKGEDGEDGSNGIGFELLGEYNASTTYNPPSLGNYECVYYNGSTYAYINSSASSGHIPPDAVSDSYWMKIANKGSVESITVSDITDFNSVMSEILSGYAQKSDTYSISQIDSLLNNKANVSDVYSTAEADMKFIDTDELSSALNNRVTLTQWSDQNNRLQGEINYLSGQISGGGYDSDALTGVYLNNEPCFEVSNRAYVMALAMTTSMPNANNTTQPYMLYLGPSMIDGDLTLTRGHLYERVADPSMPPPTQDDITLNIPAYGIIDAPLTANSNGWATGSSWTGPTVTITKENMNCQDRWKIEFTIGSDTITIYSEGTELMPWEAFGWKIMTTPPTPVDVSMTHSPHSGSGANRYSWKDIFYLTPVN